MRNCRSRGRNLLCTVVLFNQGVALTGRNCTGPPWCVGRPTADAPGGRRVDHPRARRQAGPPAGSVKDPDRRWRRQQTTDDRHQQAIQYYPITLASKMKTLKQFAPCVWGCVALVHALQVIPTRFVGVVTWRMTSSCNVTTENYQDRAASRRIAALKPVCFESE